MKTLLYAFLIYVFYRIIKRAFRFPVTTETSSTWKTDTRKTPATPPPYDTTNVEDIEFEVTKSKKTNS